MNQRDAVGELKHWLKKSQGAPWEVVAVPHAYDRTRYELYAGDWDYTEFRHGPSAEFCAAARNLLPEVLAELDAVRNELAALKKVARG